MFTLNEIRLLVALIDTGIKSVGINIYNNGNALQLQSIINKLNTIAAELQKQEEAVEEVE